MLESLKIERIHAALAGLCQTDVGSVRASTLPPAADRAEAEARFDRVGEAVRLLTGPSVPALVGRLDVSALLGHARRGGVLDGTELASLGQLARCTAAVAAEARRWPQDLATLRGDLADLPDLALLAQLLGDSIDDDGRLLDTASPALARLRADVVQIGARLRRRIGELVKETDEQGLLQDDYYTLRDDRYVLPVKSSDKRVLGGIIHGSSQTGMTVYVEPPEMVEGNNQLALAIDAVRREEHRILAELSELVADQGDEFERASARLAALDLVLAAGRLALQLDAHRPRFEAGGGLRLPAARHPLLVLDGVPVVANDVELRPPARWLVVSGPNGGGKTVVLTTVGLAVEMARRGLYVCAGQAAAMPWFESVEVVLGDAQDIERGLSTFEGHLRALQRAITAAAQASGKVLILLDELATGTEPLAGSALATAVLEHLGGLPTGCYGMVSTHFEALKLLPLRDDTFANAALELDTRTLAPTYHLRLGQIGSSSPFALAERIGLDPGLVARATELAGGGGSEVAAMLERLDTMRRELQVRLEAAIREQRQAEHVRLLLEDQRRNEQKAADRRIEKAAGEALDRIREAVHELDQARQAAKSGERKDVEQAARTLSARQVQVERLAQQAREKLAGKPERPLVRPEDLAVGARLWHEGLARVVQVLEVDSRGQRCRVGAGMLDTWCQPGDLRRPLPGDIGAKPQAKASPRPETRSVTPPAGTAAPGVEADETFALRTPEWTCDLRGQRVEEALPEVDRLLDRATLAGALGICVVHGRGTGAMRDAVRHHLRKHPQVERFRLGLQGEGGDGATMVWVKR